MVDVDLGGVSTFAAEELSSTSGVFDASVVCETLLNCAVKGSKKVGGRRRESRQQARLAARERNMMTCVWNGYRYSGMSYHAPQKNIDFGRLQCQALDFRRRGRDFASRAPRKSPSFFWTQSFPITSSPNPRHNQPPPCLRMSIWNALPSSMASVSITMSASARDRPERATPVPRRLRTTAVCARSCTRRSAARRRSR